MLHSPQKLLKVSHAEETASGDWPPKTSVPAMTTPTRRTWRWFRHNQVIAWRKRLPDFCSTLGRRAAPQ